MNLGAQLARFYHWSPADVDDLTGSDMLRWTEYANQMLERERPK